MGFFYQSFPFNGVRFIEHNRRQSQNEGAEQTKRRVDQIVSRSFYFHFIHFHKKIFQRL